MTAADAMLTLHSQAPEVTRELAGVIAAHLQPGDIVALTGELGAGKTCFVQGAAAALGVVDRVKSPTFMLRRDYAGRIGITHLDVYRLETLDEVRDLGHEDPGQEERITFVEWGDAIRPLLPTDHLEIEFQLPLPAADDLARSRPTAAESVVDEPALPAPPVPQPDRPAGREHEGGAGAEEWDFELADTRTVLVRAHGAAWLRRLDGLRIDCIPWMSA